MPFTVSGLGGSGIDVASLVSQLMSTERIPQQRLQTQKAAADADGTAWAGLKTAASALSAAVKALSSPSAVLATTPNSSDPTRIAVTSGPGATPASASVRVLSLAAAQQQASAGSASTGSLVGAGTLVLASNTAATAVADLAASSDVAAGRHLVSIARDPEGALSFTVDGVVVAPAPDTGPPAGQPGAYSVGGFAITAGPGGLQTGTLEVSVTRAEASTTLRELAIAVQAGGGPAAASAIDLGSGPNPARLVLSSTATGTRGAVSVFSSGLAGLGGLAETRAAADATLTMGSLNVTRSSNTVTDLLPGLTLQLLRADPAVDVQVGSTRDASASSTKVTGLVSAVNALLKQVTTATSSNPATRTAGPLVGDGRARSIATDLTRALGSVVGTGASSTLGAVGVRLERDGTYSVDAAALSAALDKDPAAVAALVSRAAGAVSAVTDRLVARGGALDSAADGAAATSKDIQSRIDSWDRRLELLQARYQKQFGDLDTALSGLRSQSSYLSGQLANLR